MSQYQQQKQLKLPPISQQPFKIPNDNQILLDNTGTNHLHTQKGSKIHQKMTSSCRNPLKRFDKFQTPVDDKYIPLNNYSQKQKKLIESALELIQHRKKNKDLMHPKETLHEVLEQKKEMFLVTMTHGIIEKQITNLKGQALQRQKALKQSEQILQLDMHDFEGFQERQKNQTRNIEQKYEKMVQRRLAKEQEIKSKQIAFNSLRAEKSRNQENISSYEKYKKFLNQLPPKQWAQEQERKKLKGLQQLKSRLFKQWVSSQPKTNKTQKLLKQQFLANFQKLKQSGQDEEIEQILNNQEMYFKQSKQLIEYFNNLEQGNLFCIQNVQTQDQKLQQLILKSQTHQKELSQRYETQLQHKKSLQRNLYELENQVRVLKKKKQQNSVLDGKDSNNIKTVIANEYQIMKQLMTSAYLPEIQHNAESLSLLSGIQICMEKLWERLRQCYAQNPTSVKTTKTSYQKNKTREKRQQAAKNSRDEQLRRKQRNLEKKQPTNKIIGRMDMMRSAPNQKLIKKTKVVKNKDENDDMQYLVE